MAKYPRKLPPIALTSIEPSDKSVSVPSDKSVSVPSDKYVEVIISPPDSDIERQTKTSGSCYLKSRSSFTGSKMRLKKASIISTDIPESSAIETAKKIPSTGRKSASGLEVIGLGAVSARTTHTQLSEQKLELKEASAPFSSADLLDVKKEKELLPIAAASSLIVVSSDRSTDGITQDVAIFDDYLSGLLLSIEMIKKKKLFRNDKSVADCVVELLYRHTFEAPSTIERIREIVVDATLSNKEAVYAMSLEMEKTILRNKVVFDAAKHFLAHTRDPTEQDERSYDKTSKPTKKRGSKLSLKKSVSNRPFSSRMEVKEQLLPTEWELAAQILQSMENREAATEKKLISEVVLEASKVYQKTGKAEKTPERRRSHKRRESDNLNKQLESKLQLAFKLKSESEKKIQSPKTSKKRASVKISKISLPQEAHYYKEYTQDDEREIVLPPKISITDVEYLPTVAASTRSLPMSPDQDKEELAETETAPTHDQPAKSEASIKGVSTIRSDTLIMVEKRVQQKRAILDLRPKSYPANVREPAVRAKSAIKKQAPTAKVSDQKRRSSVHISKEELNRSKQIKAKVDSKGASLQVSSKASPEMKDSEKQPKEYKLHRVKEPSIDFSLTGLEAYHTKLEHSRAGSSLDQMMEDETLVIDPEISVEMYLQAKGIFEMFQFMTTQLLIHKPKKPLDYLIGMTRTMSLGQRWSESGEAF